MSDTPLQDLVAVELTKRGYVAWQMGRKRRVLQILAKNALGTRQVILHIRSSKGSKPEWLAPASAENSHSDALFYVFVLLNEPAGPPRFYVVHSRAVSEHIAEGHRRWLAGTRRDGGPRADTNMRKFRDPDEIYLDAWHRLGLCKFAPVPRAVLRLCLVSLGRVPHFGLRPTCASLAGVGRLRRLQETHWAKPKVWHPEWQASGQRT